MRRSINQTEEKKQNKKQKKKQKKKKRGIFLNNSGITTGKLYLI
jgi:hypothetical protein